MTRTAVSVLRTFFCRNRALREAVIWMSGSPSFAPEGEAGEAFRRDVLPLILRGVSS